MVKARITIFSRIQTLAVPHLALVQINPAVEWVRFQPEGGLESNSGVL
jgi:hypothetical protein